MTPVPPSTRRRMASTQHPFGVLRQFSIGSQGILGECLPGCVQHSQARPACHFVPSELAPVEVASPLASPLPRWRAHSRPAPVAANRGKRWQTPSDQLTPPLTQEVGLLAEPCRVAAGPVFELVLHTHAHAEWPGG